MDRIKIEMLKIYKPISGLDWLNYKLVKDKVTYHHITKRDDGGKRATIINKCKYCGKDIKTNIKRNKVYCNNECRNLDYRNTHKGELSYFWQNWEKRAKEKEK